MEQGDPEYFLRCSTKFQDDVVVYDFCSSSASSMVKSAPITINN
ncbi:hypothetical protein C900_00254 [Fulvivirga imtechensis AK7]|uniref:Uncharacterized protein n=1 Tax=Fulvivirga imtechensis AK7 TaxID=1237149 RepID=L8JI63_9BACT|nr:hypothetical protein C900_00254 [Fulvivirga imtechensis AK7]